MLALKVIGMGLGSVILALVLLTIAMAIIEPQKEGVFATRIATDVVIDASPQAVWAVLSDFASYQSWNPFVLQIEGRMIASGIFDGTHGFKLTALPDARTRLDHGESFSGVFVPIFRGKMKTDTENGIRAMNTALKIRAEALAARPR